jgi:hypothetical protein
MRMEGIKMDLGETGCEKVDWIHLAQEEDEWWSAVDTVMNLQVSF